MLRNTSDGNELALPTPMPTRSHSVRVGILQRIGPSSLRVLHGVVLYSDASCQNHEKGVEQHEAVVAMGISTTL